MRKQLLMISLCMLTGAITVVGPAKNNEPAVSADQASAGPPAWIAEAQLITAEGGVLTTGAYALLDDVALTGANLTIPREAEVTIDLNGYTLNGTGEGSVITVSEGATLLLRDSSRLGSGVITGGKGTALAELESAVGDEEFTVGGGVFVNGTLHMSGGTIRDCTASAGGGVYVRAGRFEMTAGKIAGCTVSGRENVYGGGVQISNDGTFLLSGGTIENCAVIRPAEATARSFGGGGVSVYHGTFVMNGGAITGCVSDYHGGGLYVADQEAQVTLTAGAIEDCTAAANGGGVYLLNHNTVLMTGGAIKNCRANGGGAVCVQGADGVFTLQGGWLSGSLLTPAAASEFDAENGGGVYLISGTLKMESGTIAGFAAANNGGGIYVGDGGQVRITGGVIRSCEAGGNGGGVYTNGSQTTMSGGTIRDCEALVNGGGVYVLSGTFTLAERGTIKRCAAGGSVLHSQDVERPVRWDGGGGIYVAPPAELNIAGGKIFDCKADQAYGGGVFSYGSFSFSAGQITGCRAVAGGGILTADGGSLTVRGGTITGCQATSGNGGGINFNHGTMQIEGNPVITGNTRAFNGKVMAANLYVPEDRQILLAAALTDGAAIGITTGSRPQGVGTVPVTSREEKTAHFENGAQYFICDQKNIIAEADNSGNCIRLTVGQRPDDAL